MKLIESNIVFDSVSHTYTRPDGVKLSGITGVLSRQLFPTKYSGISEEVLRAAAERGTNVHEEIQMYVDGFTLANPSGEALAFIETSKAGGWEFIASEYNVTDNEHFASNIDIVASNGDLYDIKTTYRLDTEYLSWQLSIYAYLFELQNIGESAGKLYGVWLRDGQCKRVEVERIGSDTIKRLLDDEVNGRQFVNFNHLPEKEDYNQMLTLATEIEREIVSLEKRSKELKSMQDEMKDVMMRVMDENGVKCWETDTIKVTRKADSQRQTSDSARLKADNEELYKKYIKTSTVKGGVLIKIK